MWQVAVSPEEQGLLSLRNTSLVGAACQSEAKALLMQA